MPAFVLNLADGLAAHFDNVYALAPGDAGAVDVEKMNNVQLHRFTYAWPKHLQILCYRMGMVQNLKHYAPLSYLILPQFLLAQVIAIRRICRKHDISVVNSHWIVFQGLAAAIARKHCRFRHVIHIHAADLYILFRLPRAIGRYITRFIVKRSDHIICESNYVRSKLDEMLGHQSHASISCMGVDYKRFNNVDKSAERDEILFVGRLVEKKGVEYLLKAMPLVQAKYPQITLNIVGGGLLESQLKAIASDLTLPKDCIHFLGPQPHSRITELQKTARVITVPSIIDSRGETEGMPTVLLEALAAGKRVVASDVNGTPDVLRHEENGWLARPRDHEDLAAKLIDALSSNDSSITEKAQETARYYDWPNLCGRYAKILA